MAKDVNKKNKFVQEGEKFLQKQAYDKAIASYLKAHEIDPKDVRVAQKLGNLYLKNKNRKDSTKYFKIAGSIYARDGFHQRAIAVYKQVLDADPSNNEIRLEIATLYRKLGIMAEATPHFKEALKFYEEQNDKEKCLDIVRHLAELEPRNVGHRIKLAEYLLKDGKRDQGYNEFKKAAKELRAAGRWDDLVKLFDKLVKADPSNIDNLLGYGEALIEKGDNEKARDNFKQVLKYKPDNLEALEQLYKISTRLQDVEMAVYYLKEKAKISEKIGDKEDARICFEKIVKILPGDEEAKKKLKTLGGVVPESKPDAPHTRPAASQPPSSRPDPAPQKPAAPPPARPKITIEEDDDNDYALGPADVDVDVDETPLQIEIDAAPPPPPKQAPAKPSAPLAPKPAPPKPAAAPKKAVETDIPAKDQVPGLLTEADVYLRYGLIDKAADYVNRVLQGFPTNHQALRLKGLLSKEHGNIKDAIDSLLLAISAARSQNDEDAARTYIGETLTIEPANPIANAHLEELNAGVEIDVDIDEEPAAEAQSESDTIAFDDPAPAKREDEQLELAGGDEDVFSFVEDAGDDQLSLIDEDEIYTKAKKAPPPPKPAPAPKPVPKPPPPKAAPPQDDSLLFEIEDDVEKPSLDDDEPLDFESEPPPPPPPVKKPAPPPPAPARKPAAPPPQAAKAAPPPPPAKPAPEPDLPIMEIEDEPPMEMEPEGVPAEEPLLMEFEDEPAAMKVETEIEKPPAKVEARPAAKITAVPPSNMTVLEEIEDLEEEEEEEVELEVIADLALDEMQEPTEAAFDDEEVVVEQFEEEEIPEPAAVSAAAAPVEIETAVSKPSAKTVDGGWDPEEAWAEVEAEEAPDAVQETAAVVEEKIEDEKEQAIEVQAEEEAEAEAEVEAAVDDDWDEPVLTKAAPSAASKAELQAEAVDNEIEPEWPDEPEHAVATEAADDEIESEWPEEMEPEKPGVVLSKKQEIEEVAEAADEAWSEAIEDDEYSIAKTEPVQSELDGMDNFADEVLGEVFGEEAAAKSGEPSDLFDLCSVLSEDLKCDNFDLESKDDLGDVMKSFREGVKEQIGEDADTYFNLGIAYKEMGLMRDAVGTFQSALKAGYSPADSIMMIGLCFMDLGEYPKAERIFKEGLSIEGLSEDAVLSLTFDTAQAIEKQNGREKEALDYYKRVESVNPYFHDVNKAVERLKQYDDAPAASDAPAQVSRLAPEASKVAPSGASRRKISYI